MAEWLELLASLNWFWIQICKLHAKTLPATEKLGSIVDYYASCSCSSQASAKDNNTSLSRAQATNMEAGRKVFRDLQ
jgi:hypothetical protein